MFYLAHQLVSPIAPTRLFNALIKDADNLLPKLVPQRIISVEILQGDGGAGTIRKITFMEGDKQSYAKTQVDEFNEETLTFKYTVIEGDSIAGKFDKVAREVQFVPSESGGAVSKMVTHCYPTSDDVEITEEEMNGAKDKAHVMQKVVEAYLLKNPEAYA